MESLDVPSSDREMPMATCRIPSLPALAAALLCTVMACGDSVLQPTAGREPSDGWFSLDNMRLELSTANMYLCTTLSWNGPGNNPEYRRGEVRLDGPTPVTAADGGAAVAAVPLAPFRFVRVDPRSRTKLREVNCVIPDTKAAKDFVLERFVNSATGLLPSARQARLLGWGGAELVNCWYYYDLDRLECDGGVNCNAAGIWYSCDNDCVIFGDPDDPYDTGGYFWCPGGGGGEPPPGEECDPAYEACCEDEGDPELGIVRPQGAYPNPPECEEEEEEEEEEPLEFEEDINGPCDPYNPDCYDPLTPQDSLAFAAMRPSFRDSATFTDTLARRLCDQIKTKYDSLWTAGRVFRGDSTIADGGIAHTAGAAKDHDGNWLFHVDHEVLREVQIGAPNRDFYLRVLAEQAFHETAHTIVNPATGTEYVHGDKTQYNSYTEVPFKWTTRPKGTGAPQEPNSCINWGAYPP